MNPASIAIPAGYEALRSGAAWLDLSGRGKIKATGEDRARLLHAMTTNHVEQLTPGTGCYAYFLSAQGRILGDVNLLCRPDHFLLDTEPHPDHTTGHFVFSPPAVIIAHERATASMVGREKETPGRIEKLAGTSPEMRKALDGYRFVPPQIEYRQKATINLGERTFELMYLKGVHSEADTAVWLPKERVLFSASGIVVDQINILRPFVTIPDILAASKMMKALNPEFVIPGHGQPGTVKIFDDTEKYYALLLERVGKLAKEGKSLDEIKKEVKMPEYDSWASKERFPSNVEAAYKAVKGS